MWYQMQKDAEISRVEFTKKMWSTINAEAEWLQDLKNELGDLEKVREVKISAPMTKKQLRKMPNWKSVGPFGMQGYWLKKFRALHERIATWLNECLFLRSVPENG